MSSDVENFQMFHQRRNGDGKDHKSMILAIISH
jgi:hypothetical protein